MEIATTENNNKLAGITEYSAEQVAVIKKVIAKNVTDVELGVFLMTCHSNGLNPLNKEIWCYKDKSQNVIIFAGRDGFLKKAQQSKLWNGISSSAVRENDKISFDIPNGKINHTFSPTENRGKIIGAYAICQPKGTSQKTIEYVDFETYDKGYNTWKSHPEEMIKKVAEIKALKKAYGISGLQTEHDFNIINENAYAIDTEEQASPSQFTYAEQLLRKVLISEQEIQGIERELENPKLPQSRLSEIISYLKDNQANEADLGTQESISKSLEWIK